MRYITASTILPFDWPPYSSHSRSTAGSQAGEEQVRASDNFFRVTTPIGFVDKLFESQPPPMLQTPEAVLRCLEAFNGMKDDQ